MMGNVRSENAKIVAVLHDVVEDCDGWTFERLRSEGFGEEIIAALDCVTKREGESYEDFIGCSVSNDVAREVKIADLEDNMDIRRLDRLTERDLERLTKYHRAWTRLLG